MAGEYRRALAPQNAEPVRKGRRAAVSTTVAPPPDALP